MKATTVPGKSSLVLFKNNLHISSDNTNKQALRRY